MTPPPEATPSPNWDCIIVGAGPAGLNAALVLGRARWRVLVADNRAPRNYADKTAGIAIFARAVVHGGYGYGGIAAYSRDPVDGSLRQLFGRRGCVSVTGSRGCLRDQRLDGGVYQLAVAPGGQALYTITNTEPLSEGPRSHPLMRDGSVGRSTRAASWPHWFDGTDPPEGMAVGFGRARVCRWPQRRRHAGETVSLGVCEATRSGGREARASR